MKNSENLIFSEDFFQIKNQIISFHKEMEFPLSLKTISISLWQENPFLNGSVLQRRETLLASIERVARSEKKLFFA